MSLVTKEATKEPKEPRDVTLEVKRQTRVLSQGRPWSVARVVVVEVSLETRVETRVLMFAFAFVLSVAWWPALSLSLLLLAVRVLRVECRREVRCDWSRSILSSLCLGGGRRSLAGLDVFVSSRLVLS